MSEQRKAKSFGRRPWRESVAVEMIRQIEAGTAPFQKPWKPGIVVDKPHNPTSKRAYNGINALWLEMQGHADPRWLTYKQAVALDAQVRGGEKSTQVEYWKWSGTGPLKDAEGKPVLGDDGKPKTTTYRLDRPKVFYANVFNASQIDGLEPYIAPEPGFDPLEKAEALLAAGTVSIKHDKADRAYYSPAHDEIHLPDKSSFKGAYEYYATALHELGHATGHSTRMGRDFGPFGSEVYAKEELRAEMASYMVSRELGLGHYPERHAGYVENWLKALRDDRNVLFQVAKDSEQIASWIKEPELRPELERNAQDKKKGIQMQDKQTHEVKHTINGLPPAKGDRIYLAVPFDEKDQAKSSGAKWDRKAKSWYLPVGIEWKPLFKWLPENQPERGEKDHDPVVEFGDELKAAGIDLKDAPLMDGKWHRVALEGDKKGEKNASYRAFLDGVPNGQIKNFRSDDLTRWVSRGEKLSDEQRATIKAEFAQRQSKRIEERQVVQKDASMVAQSRWDKAKDVSGLSTAYLQSKRVENHGLKIDDKGRTLIPLRDIEGKLWSVQSINKEGLKRFTTGAKKRGLMHVIDPLNLIDQKSGSKGATGINKGTIFVAEGYSTAASVFEATNQPTVVAFDASNLKPVGEAIHKKYPQAKIVMAADNDHKLEDRPIGNVGMTKAIDAAIAVGGSVVAPVLTKQQKEKGLSDWNDLANDQHSSTVVEQIRQQLKQQRTKEKPLSISKTKSKKTAKTASMSM